MDINVTKKYIRILPNDRLAIDRAFSDIYKQVNSIIDADLAHNDLSGIQGGSATERYHLTVAQQGVLHDPATVGGYPLSINGQQISFDYDTTNLKLTSNQLDTIQGISSVATPTFANLTLTDNFYNDNTNYNLRIGLDAGKYISQAGGGINGKYNVYIGVAAGKGGAGGSTAYYCFAGGTGALQSITSGYYDFALGGLALANLTTGYRDTAIGYAAGYALVNGLRSIFIGSYAGRYNVSGINNTLVGDQCGFKSLGSYLTFIGQGAGPGVSNSTSNHIIAIGYLTAHNLTTASNGIYVGDYAGYNQTTLDNLLIIDNQDRGSAANEITNSLIYGVFDANPANQTLRVNAALTANNFISNVAIGTSPYACISTTLNSNLNADLLDGYHLGTSGDTYPLLSGANTWSGTQKIDVSSTRALFVEQDGVNDNTFIVDTTNGVVSIGASPLTNNLLYVCREMPATLTSICGLFGGVSSPRDDTLDNVYGLNFMAKWYPPALTDDRIATNMYGTYSQIQARRPTGATYNMTVTNACGFLSVMFLTNGPIVTTYKQFSTENATGAIGTMYGFYDAGLTGAGTNWGFYGLSAQNLMSGKLRLGSTTAPNALLALAAGTATAGTAPLKFTSGALLGTLELGALEFTDDGTTGHLYITQNVAGALTRVLIS